MKSKAAETQAQLVEDILKHVHDPLGFIQYDIPWGQGELADYQGLRTWQARVLREIRDHLQNPETIFSPMLLAVASGKGIGKSALVGFTILWAMSTCEDCKVVITANTDTQLRTKTWPEVSKWFRSALNSHWFDVEAESITIKDPAHKRTWRADRIPWTENNTEAFAGLHNQGKRIVVIFDEASAISDKIWKVTEGTLTDENTEIIWLAFGNPTRTDGRFRECFGKFRHRWKTFQIDSRDVEGTNKQELQQQVEDYGEDSDHVKIWIKGDFPSRSSIQFISPEAVKFCMTRYKAEGYEQLPKIMSVDVARFGDDQTVIGYRQGRKAVILGKYRNLDGIQIAERIIEFAEEQEPITVVVDSDGPGSSVIDQLKARNFKKVVEFHGAHKADDVDQYFNKRTEIWGLLRDWLKDGAELPDDPELHDDLVGPEYLYSNKGQIQLEPKKLMKSRGLASPDVGDMLALTFAPKIYLPKLPSKGKFKPARDRSPQGWMTA